MSRARRPAVYLTNTHPIGRTCGICSGPIHDGQGAYVTSDGRHANHSVPAQCGTSDGAR
jgi:hypothetical protein